MRNYEDIVSDLKDEILSIAYIEEKSRKKEKYIVQNSTSQFYYNQRFLLINSN